MKPHIPLTDISARPKTLREEIEKICVIEGGYPDAWPSHEACPCCGGSTLRYAFSKHGFAHDLCADCAFVLVNPYPPEHVLTGLYDGAYYSNVREFYEKPLLENGSKDMPFSAPKEDLLALAEKAVAGRSEGTWLDVGGGVGVLCSLVAQAYPGWDVSLNELNSASLEIAQTLFGDHISLEANSAADIQKSGARFDVISMIMMLEHVPNPRAIIEDYVKLLNPGGKLVVMVPHMTNFMTHVAKGSSPAVTPPFHLSLFSELSLKQLGDRTSGVSKITIEQNGNAAFRLIDIVDSGEHWDITIPDKDDPAPRSKMLMPYGPDGAKLINALSKLTEVSDAYLKERDGQAYLIGWFDAATTT
ncbi:MAG: class I SAM-dependent methyltransferase [Pikeienuella sp.]